MAVVHYFPTTLINTAIDSTPEALLHRGKRKQLQLFNASKAKAKRHCSHNEKDVVMVSTCHTIALILPIILLYTLSRLVS